MSTENLEQLEPEGTVVGAEGEDNVDVDVDSSVSPEQQADEARARRQGWRPLEEFHGDKSRWVDAKTFNERADHELPIMRERYRKMEHQLTSNEKKLSDAEKKITEMSQVLVEVRDLSKSAEERGFQRAMSDFAAREVAAVRNADEAEFARIQYEKQELERARPKAAPPPPPAQAAPAAEQQVVPNPVVQGWIAENEWYRNSPSMQAYANEMDAEVEREFSHWPMGDKLGEVKRRVMEKFPERFPAAPARKPSAVSAPAAPAQPIRKPKGKTVADLPPDARAALEKYKRQIPGYKDEDYLKLYFQAE